MRNTFARLSPIVRFSGLAAILFFIGYVQADETGERKIKVDDSTFKCILKMTAVRHFFVDNLVDIWRAPSRSPRRERANIPRELCCSRSPTRP